MRKKQCAAPKPGRRIFVGWVVGAGTPDKYCFPAYTVGAGTPADLPLYAAPFNSAFSPAPRKIRLMMTNSHRMTRITAVSEP